MCGNNMERYVVMKNLKGIGKTADGKIAHLRFFLELPPLRHPGTLCPSWFYHLVWNYGDAGNIWGKPSFCHDNYMLAVSQ